MEIEIRKKTIFKILKLVLGLIGIIVLVFLFSRLYQNQLRPIKTIYLGDMPFSFRRDIRRALELEIFPKEELLHDLFSDFQMRNITILFKAGTPETNALSQIQTFELTYKLFRYDDITRGALRPKKTFSAKEIENYENITREENVLKIILVPPEFSDETRVTAGGNRIWIYGKSEKEFDLATMKAILSMMNVTSIQGLVN
jgi:hypothetical protein